MPHVAFQGAAQALVLVHAIVGLALCGAATHHVVVAAGYLRGVYRWRLAQTYAIVTMACYATVMALGMMAYPSYRYFVRALYLDHNLLWASKLFDLKETVAAIGLPCAVAVLVMSRQLRPDRDRSFLAPYLALVTLVALQSWFPAISGLIITLQRGVPR